jgi:hypothetical protein
MGRGPTVGQGQEADVDSRRWRPTVAAMSNTLTSRKSSRAGLAGLGLALAFTAQYLRAWPYPHWMLNIIYGLWLLGAVSLLAGWGSMQSENRSLVVPTEPAKHDRYHRLLRESVFGWGLLVVLFIAPYATEWSSLQTRVQVVLLVGGWAASLAILTGLMRNRSRWVALMTPPDRV